MNVHAGTQLFTELLGYPPRSVDPSTIDFAEADVFIPHPLYGSLGWVAVVEPGEWTTPRLLEVLGCRRRRGHGARHHRSDHGFV